MVARLLDRSGEGSLAAVVLFRLLLDRLSHPRAPATLPASVVAGQLGLSDDQARRGMRALLQRDLVVEQGTAGRAKQYYLADAVLVGAAAASGGPVTLLRPAAATPSPQAASAAPAAGERDASALGASPVGSLRGGAIVEYGGQRIELPAQAELSVAVPGTRVAGMHVDPATGRLVVRLEPTGPG